MQSEWAKPEAISELLARHGGSIKTGPFGTTLKASEYASVGVPLISVREIGHGSFHVDAKTPRVDAATLARLPEYILEEGDVVFARKGGIERCALVRKQQAGWFLGSDGIRLRPPKVCDARFLAYSLQTPAVKDWLVQHSTGSTMASLNQSTIGRLPVAFPSVSTQRAVADTLEVFDDRIDLLRQTNATLESIAQALFKSWFIDFDPVRAKAEGREPFGLDAATAALFPAEFEESALGVIPKGWGVQRLSDVLELAYGKALKATDRRDGQVPVYGSGGITGFHDEALVQTGSVIVGRKGTVGSLYWEDKPFFPIDTTFYVKPRTAPLTFCFYALQRLGLESMNTDAAVPGLNRENAYRLELTRPTSAVLRAFDNIAASLRATMRCNDERAALLDGLRDTLLPRLISGKLRLTEAREQVEEVI